MTLFDLFFVLLFLAAAGSLSVACVSLLRGRRAVAYVIVRRLGVAVAAYLAVVAAAGVASPRVVRPRQQDQCSDDWCIAVDSVHRDSAAGQTTYEVGFRLSSRARRASQRERWVVPYVLTAEGQRIDALRDAAAIPFDTLLRPGETIRVKRRFIVPANAGNADLVIAREGGLGFPGCCIIGDENSFFHKRAVTPLR